MQLPDVNVWLTFDSHIHHPKAKTWFDAQSIDADICFCRTSQQGFLRLSTNQSVFGAHALTLLEAWQKYDLFLSDRRIVFAEEPIGLEGHWRTFTQRRTFSPQVWGDAYLAAFALAGNFEMVTLDQGFKQYPNVRCTILP